MEKFTYLLGAGASANKLPTVKKLPKALRGSANELRKIINRKISDENKEFIEKYIDDLNWLAEKSEKFDSVDTFAKYCYLKNLADLKRLKQTLSKFFTLEQVYNKQIDNRYLVFLTTIFQRGLSFPEKIKILNWNYDYQIQIAAENFIQESYNIEYKGTSAHADPIVKYYPCTGYEPKEPVEDYSIVHLNGVAGFIIERSSKFTVNIFLKRSDDINIIIDEIKKYEEPGFSEQDAFISFAWERNHEEQSVENEILTIAKNLVRNTNYLIVIGYSFPFFNREIDKEIFKVLNEKPGVLQKIYFQNPNMDGQFLIDQFNLFIKPNGIKHIPNVDQFYVPFEL